ncbi:hypothetical protein Tco_1567356, partial [Tanacetum coccineum]
DEEDYKISSNPLFDLDEVSPIDEEVFENTNSIPSGIEISCFNPESDLLESLLNRDSSINSSQKIDFLLDEFVANSNTIIESLPISVDDLREEIDIFSSPEDSIPPGIESDDYNSEDNDNFTSRPEFESFHVDYPNLGDSTIVVVEDIPVDVPKFYDFGSNLDGSSPSGNRHMIYDPGICIEVKSTRILALPPMIDTLLPFSSKNKDRVFNHGVLALKEKSPPSSSHRGFKASKLFLHKSPMLIHGDNTPNLGVRHPHFYPP